MNTVETKGTTTERTNVAFFALEFEKALYSAEADSKLVVSLPDLIPIWIPSVEAGFDMIDKIYTILGEPKLYSLRTTLTDDEVVSLYVDDTLVISGETSKELRDLVDEEIRRIQRPRW